MFTQNPHAGSQISVKQVPRDSTTSLRSCGTGVTHVSHILGMYVVHKDTGRQNTHTYKYYIYMGVYMHIYTHKYTGLYIMSYT